MRKSFVIVSLIALVTLGIGLGAAGRAQAPRMAGGVAPHAAGRGGTAAPAWAMNATIIEACSCKMFCQCYFNTEPSEHEGHGGGAGMAADHGQGKGGDHFCRFNNAFQVNHGHHGAVRLDGAKFWVAGDLGGDFTKGMDWAVLAFDPGVTAAQRKGIQAILAHLYPVKWNAFTIGPDAPMEWRHSRTEAVARLDGGKAAEVVLKPPKTALDDAAPMVLKNLRYWGAPRNTGFVMMPNEIEAYRRGDKPFEFKGTNGFMITIDIDANSAPPAAASGM